MAKSSKPKKKITKNQQEYAKQVKRIQQIVKRAEKRGYTFDKPVLPEKPKKITKAAIEKLKELRPEKIYGKAKFKTPSGREISGKQRRQAERKAAAKRGQAKKQSKKELKKLARLGEAVKKQNIQSKQIRDLAGVHIPTKGELILAHLMELINQYDTDGAKYLKQMLSNMISKYGKDAVAKALEQTPTEMVEEAQNLIFYEAKSGYNTRAVRNLADAIRSAIASAAEAVELNNILEQMEQ